MTSCQNPSLSQVFKNMIDLERKMMHDSFEATRDMQMMHNYFLHGRLLLLYLIIGPVGKRNI